MAAGWPVPATEKAGIEFDRAAGEQGAEGGGGDGLREPGGEAGEGKAEPEAFRRPRRCLAAGGGLLSRISAAHNPALGCGFCSAFGAKLWEEMGRREGSGDEEAEGREAEE